MIQGTYSSPLFSEGFVRERAEVHCVCVTAYLEKLSGFMDVLNHAGEYDEIVPFVIARFPAAAFLPDLSKKSSFLDITARFIRRMGDILRGREIFIG